MSRILGLIGERQAEKFLKRHGFTILEKNYYSRFGEIDIIAKHNNTLVFIEVKKRKNVDFAGGAEYVDARKQKRIVATAQIYIQNNCVETDVRFDVIEINGTTINHIENAF